MIHLLRLLFCVGHHTTHIDSAFPFGEEQVSGGGDHPNPYTQECAFKTRRHLRTKKTLSVMDLKPIRGANQ